MRGARPPAFLLKVFRVRLGVFTLFAIGFAFGVGLSAAWSQDLTIDSGRADRRAAAADLETPRDAPRADHVTDVVLEGETGGDLTLIRHYAARIAAERPLTRATTERQLSLISDIPGLETRVLTAPSTEQGGVRMGLVLDQTPWEYSIGVNNSGSAALGRVQLEAAIIRNGLFRMGDRTRVSLGADSQFERLLFGAIAHRQPIGYDGMAIEGSFTALRTETSPGVRGDARAASIAISYPWLRSYRRNLIFGASLDGVNSDNALLGDTVSSERTRALRASLAFSDAQPRRAFSAGVALSQGLDGLGARTLDASTTLDFTKLNVQLAYNQALGRAFVARFAAGGQAGGDALPASERFTLGGLRYARAFAAASASGDDGIGASAEIAWRREGVLSETYVFADGGRAWTVDRPLVAGTTRDLASAGAGVRLRIAGDTRLDLEAAKPLDEPAPGADLGGWRFRFGLSARL